MNSKNPPLLVVSNVSVSYGELSAVRDASLVVNQGEIITLLGVNGAGKSSLLKSICRLVGVQSGDILFNGKSLLSLPTTHLVKMGLALVPENRRVFPALTVRQNLEVGAYGQTRPTIKKRVEEMIELFPVLGKYASKMAVGLSGGEQQMLAIARALMSKPSLILLDEPSLGLAPILVDQVFDKLVEINKLGTTILLVEQNAWLALDVAHRGYVMESGKITMSGTSKSLRDDDSIKAAYLGVQGF